MSIWASIGSDETDIPCYKGDYGREIDPDGYIDVAVAWGMTRVSVECEHGGDASIALDEEGVRELISRLNRALPKRP